MPDRETILSYCRTEVEDALARRVGCYDIEHVAWCDWDGHVCRIHVDLFVSPYTVYSRFTIQGVVVTGSEYAIKRAVETKIGRSIELLRIANTRTA